MAHDFDFTLYFRPVMFLAVFFFFFAHFEKSEINSFERGLSCAFL